MGDLLSSCGAGQICRGVRSGMEEGWDDGRGELGDGGLKVQLLSNISLLCEYRCGTRRSIQHESACKVLTALCKGLSLPLCFCV